FPLARAAFRGDLEMLRAILRAGGGTDAEAKLEALNWAAHGGKRGAIRFLIENGTDPRALPKKGEPPIIAAAATGIPAAVEELLKYRPNLSVRGDEGMTALIAAVEGRMPRDWPGVNRLEVVRLLLEADAEVDARD